MQAGVDPAGAIAGAKRSAPVEEGRDDTGGGGDASRALKRLRPASPPAVATKTNGRSENIIALDLEFDLGHYQIVEGGENAGQIQKIFEIAVIVLDKDLRELGRYEAPIVEEVMDYRTYCCASAKA